MKFVKLTRDDSVTIWVNLDRVEQMMRDEGNGVTALFFASDDDSQVVVFETPDKILWAAAP